MINEFKLTDKMQGNDLKKAALAYARAGIPVFPLKKKGKIPMYKGGFHKATTDLKKIKKWWDKHPNANIGSPLIENLIVLDFDGEKGLKTYEALNFKKPTLKVKTARGFHLYYKANLVSKNAVMDGLDLKGGGEGGYIIMPPSIHPTGTQYTWDEDLKIKQLPERVITLLQKKNESSETTTTDGTPLIIPEGGRHTHMVSLAGYYVHKGYDQEQVSRFLTTANEISFTKPLPASEIYSIARGCSEYDNNDDTQTLRLSDQEEKEPEFLIKPYICVGESNLLEGDPGCGKSTLLGEMAASITTGKEFCGIKPERTGNVLFFAIEDNPTSVFKTRARLQGADQSKIYYVDGYLSLDDSGFNYLEKELSSNKFELVIIDTFTSVLGDMSMNDNTRMNKLVKRISNLVRAHDSSAILVRHLRKTDTNNSSYAGSGATSIIGSARSALLMKRCPENRDERYIAQNKCNGVREGKTLKFKITDAPNTEIGQLVWMGSSDLVAEDLLMLHPKKEKESDRAENFVRELLSNGAVKCKTIENEANENGIAKKTLERAKKNLGVKSVRIGKVWGWKLL